MPRLLEKWYVLLMLIRIARHNRMRMKFVERHDVFDDFGQGIAYMTLEKRYERNGKLYKRAKDSREYKVASRPQRGDFGLYEYVHQRCGYCEDDYYGTIWTKTPFRNIWLERSYNC